jgi:molybdate transport system regulatory protein
MTEANSATDSSPGRRRGPRIRTFSRHDAERSSAVDRPRVNVGHRVYLHERGEIFFGPGIYELLVLTDETGSLRQAAKTMGMAYSKAWTIMREAETHFGLKLLERQAGGPTGGGSVLTDDARQLLFHFKALIDEADAMLDRLYRKHFGNAPYAKPAGGPAEMPEVDPSA